MKEDAIFYVGQKAFIEKEWLDETNFHEVEEGSEFFAALKKYFEK